MNIKAFHENEARILALELYNLELRRDEIRKRLRDIGVTLQAIDRVEAELVESLQSAEKDDPQRQA